MHYAQKYPLDYNQKLTLFSVLEIVLIHCKCESQWQLCNYDEIHSCSCLSGLTVNSPVHAVCYQSHSPPDVPDREDNNHSHQGGNSQQGGHNHKGDGQVTASTSIRGQALGANSSTTLT